MVDICHTLFQNVLKFVRTDAPTATKYSEWHCRLKGNAEEMPGLETEKWGPQAVLEVKLGFNEQIGVEGGWSESDSSGNLLEIIKKR